MRVAYAIRTLGLQKEMQCHKLPLRFRELENVRAGDALNREIVRVGMAGLNCQGYQHQGDEDFEFGSEDHSLVEFAPGGWSRRKTKPYSQSRPNYLSSSSNRRLIRSRAAGRSD